MSPKNPVLFGLEYGGLVLIEIFLQTDSLRHQLMSDVIIQTSSFCHFPSHQNALETPKRLSTRKGPVLISMYDQTVTFLGDIFVTFCPNGATEMVNMLCIK